MANDAQIAQHLQRTNEAIDHLYKTVDSLKDRIGRLEEAHGRFMTTSMVHPASANQSDIREMFLLEILRQKGLLDGLDIAAIEALVREHLATKNIPWGASQKTAEKNVETVKREITGDYSDDDDD